MGEQEGGGASHQCPVVEIFAVVGQAASCEQTLGASDVPSDGEDRAAYASEEAYFPSTVYNITIYQEV